MNWVNRIIDNIYIYIYHLQLCFKESWSWVRRVEKSINYAIKMSLQHTKSFFWAKQITQSKERREFFFIKKPRFFFLLLKDSRRWKQLMMLDYLSEIYVVRYVSKIHIPKILSGDRDLCFMAAIMRTFSRLSPLTEKKFLSCITRILKECNCDFSLYIQFHLWECDILMLATTTL